MKPHQVRDILLKYQLPRDWSLHGSMSGKTLTLELRDPSGQWYFITPENTSHRAITNILRAFLAAHKTEHQRPALYQPKTGP